MEPVFFHVDLDAFYASVEQSDNPELTGKPVIIGALPGHRGVVSACSYEARKYGVHSAMPISQAYRLCRNGVYLAPRMDRYQEISRDIMRIFDDFTPDVRQLSIDEAVLDMTGTERLLGPPEKSARRIKRHVRDGYRLSISVGIAPNRYLAKLASEFDKPDGLYRVFPGEEEAFLDGLEMSDLWGLGSKMLERLQELNINTIPELRRHDEGLLKSLLGNAAGSYLFRIVRGLEPSGFRRDPKSRSISSEITFEHDTRDRETVHRVLLELSHQVMFRMLDEGYQSSTVQIKVRYSDFSTTTAQRKLGHRLLSAEELYSISTDLLEKRWSPGSLIRLIGVGVSGLEQANEPAQSELFTDSYEKKKRVEEAVLNLRKKNGHNELIKASLLGLKKRYRHDQE